VEVISITEQSRAQIERIFFDKQVSTPMGGAGQGSTHVFAPTSYQRCVESCVSTNNEAFQKSGTAQNALMSPLSLPIYSRSRIDASGSHSQAKSLDSFDDEKLIAPSNTSSIRHEQQKICSKTNCPDTNLNITNFGAQE